MLAIISLLIIIFWYGGFAFYQARQMDKEYQELLKKDKPAAEAAREAYLHTYTHFF